MALIQCPDCKREVSPDEKICPSCHCKVRVAWKRNVPVWWKLITALSGFVAVVGFLYHPMAAAEGIHGPQDDWQIIGAVSLGVCLVSWVGARMKYRPKVC